MQMSTSNFATHAQTHTGSTYGENLGRAFRELVAALLAAQPAQASQAAIVQKEKAVSEHATTADLRKLYRLARGTDSVSPKVIDALAANQG
jgi:hypothetical protein